MPFTLKSLANSYSSKNEVLGFSDKVSKIERYQYTFTNFSFAQTKQLLLPSYNSVRLSDQHLCNSTQNIQFIFRKFAKINVMCVRTG